MKTFFRLCVCLLFICALSSAQDVSSGYVDVGGDKLFYEEAGEGPALILIHDGLVHCEIWNDQFTHFAKSYRVIRYDRRGYGKSSADNTNYTNVEDLKLLMEHLEIEDATLIGMSSGGRLVIDFTLAYPDKVSAMVLVGAVVAGFPYTQHFYTRGGHLPTDLKTREESHAYYAAEDPYEIYRENKAATEKVVKLVRDNPRQEHHSTGAAPSVPAIERLREIKVPALILAGEFDIPDVHAHAGAINAGIPNSEREIIPKSGHLVPIEQPELFIAAVEKFLAR